MLAPAMTGKAWASPETKIAIDPAEVKDLPPGEAFSVNVTIADVANLFGWQINVTFDSGVLNVVKATEGTFLKNVNRTAWPTPKIDNSTGYVLASASFMPPYPSGGANGNGILANITFTVKSGGTSTLHFERGTKLRTVEAGNVVPIENFATEDGVFRGVGGTGGLPLELIAGAAVVIVVAGVTGGFYLRRRKK